MLTFLAFMKHYYDINIFILYHHYVDIKTKHASMCVFFPIPINIMQNTTPNKIATVDIPKMGSVPMHVR